MSFQTPILLIGFNRPDKISASLELLNKIEPQNLYVCIDGPRKNNLDDLEKNISILEQIKKFEKIIKKTLTRKQNLGCKVGVSDAINWFFENNEMGIILEDDCLPDISFFKYCEDLLIKYRENKSIMHISGHKKILDELDTEESYYFSKIANIWGWATWKDRWKFYDISMSNLEKDRGIIINSFKNKKFGKYWYRLFQYIRDRKVDTWDAQWQYTVFVNKGITISPTKNLILNVGFDDKATHTNTKDDSLNERISSIINIKHPEKIEINQDFDNLEMKIRHKNVLQKIMSKIKKQYE